MSIKIPSLDQLIESYLICCTTEGKSPKTTEFYSNNLKRFSRFLKIQELTTLLPEIGVGEARKFIFYLQNNAIRWEDSPIIKDDEHLSPFSVQAYVRAIKAFWTWLFNEGFINSNTMSSLKLPRVPKKIVNTFSQEQVYRMIRSINQKTTRGFRDYLILLILLDTGIRLSELMGLSIDNIDFGQNCFLVRGKGDKERLVPFGNRVRHALWQYIRNFRPEPRMDGINQILLTDSGYPLRPRAVQIMINRLGNRAGVTGVRCSPHKFRHTFAKNYLLLGGDVFSLQRILGHSSLEVVKLYINLAASDVSEQHRRFSPIDNMGSKKRRPSSESFRQNNTFEKIISRRVHGRRY
jgi:site-specific recombinase XerD